MLFSHYRDGSFYYLEDLDKINDFVIDVIGGLKTTSYKNVNVNIKSPYPIDNFYESEKLSNISYKELSH